MKTKFILFFLFTPFLTFAQSTEYIGYEILINSAKSSNGKTKDVGMKINVIQGSITGKIIYSEHHNITIPSTGLAKIKIGNGEKISGSYKMINWQNGPYFIRTETDLKGQRNYTKIATSQLLIAHRAIHAKTADELIHPITETDPIYTNSNASRITEKDIKNLENLTGVNTGDQKLKIDGDKLTISNGNTITLPGGLVPIFTSDEIHALNPQDGFAVFNSTEKLYQVYESGQWNAFASNCWPQPTIANAGEDQIFTSNATSTSLKANSPSKHHGKASWELLQVKAEIFQTPKTQTRHLVEN